MSKKIFQIGEVVHIIGPGDTKHRGIVTGIYLHLDCAPALRYTYGVDVQATGNHLICKPEELLEIVERQTSPPVTVA